MVRFGVNLWIWTTPSTESIIKLLPKAKEMGFDGVEVPVEEPSALDIRKIKEGLDSLGLGCTVCGFFVAGRDPLENAQRKIAEKYVKRCIDIALGLGSEIVAGPLYAPVGKLVGRARTDAEWRSVVEFLKDVGAYAGDCGAKLAIEPINRYETYILNITNDCAKLIEEVGSPNVGIHLDTYHMNIEEKDFHTPIKVAGKRLYHMHLSESDRGVPGTGQVSWKDVMRALKEIGYEGWLVIESFVLGVGVAAAAAIWREIAPSGDVLAGEGLQYLKSLWKVV